MRVLFILNEAYCIANSEVNAKIKLEYILFEFDRNFDF
jgi:hypothetical protein